MRARNTFLPASGLPGAPLKDLGSESSTTSSLTGCCAVAAVRKGKQEGSRQEAAHVSIPLREPRLL